MSPEFEAASHARVCEPPVLAEREIEIMLVTLDDEAIFGKTDTIPQNVSFAIKNTIIKDMMSENSIDYNVENPFFRSSQKNIAQESKESSILIKCYGFLNES